MIKAADTERPQPTWRAEEMAQEQLFPYAFPEVRNRSALDLAGKRSNLFLFTSFRKLPGEFMTLVYQTPFWVLILEGSQKQSEEFISNQSLHTQIKQNSF